MMEHNYYFGFGANKDPRMMEAIIGRRPEGFPGHIKGFELCIQNWEELSEKAKKRLTPFWDTSFRSYIIRTNKKGIVYGTVWKISPKERLMVKAWELVGLWSENVETTAYSEQGEVRVVTEKVDDPKVKTVVREKDYPAFVVPMRDILRVAMQDFEEKYKD